MLNEAKGTARPRPFPDLLRRMLYFMSLQREVEDRIVSLYRQGKIVGGVYTGRGQEAIGVGYALPLVEHDVVFPCHRDLGAFLIKGMTVERIFAQYLGRVGGPTRGRDANLHMGDLDIGIGSFISHMADTVPVAAGVALSFQLRNQPNVAVCATGDGATSRGDWHEGLNLAAVLSLPVVYVCVNNLYAYSTPIERQMAVSTVAERASGYGMPVVRVDGNDVEAVHEAASQAIERARAGDGPSFIEGFTYRMTGHSAADDTSYVPPEMLEEGKARDPLDAFVRRLQERGMLDGNELVQLQESVKDAVETGLKRALESPYPESADAAGGVYAD